MLLLLWCYCDGNGNGSCSSGSCCCCCAAATSQELSSLCCELNWISAMLLLLSTLLLQLGFPFRSTWLPMSTVQCGRPVSRLAGWLGEQTVALEAAQGVRWQALPEHSSSQAACWWRGKARNLYIGGQLVLARRSLP